MKDQVLFRFAYSSLFRLILLLPAIYLITGCSQPVVFDNNKRISENVWKAEHIIRFDMEINDTISPCKFYLNVRHTTDYRYANLFLFINTIFPDGKAARDTVECILAEPSGKWLGKGISNTKDNQVLLRRGIRFPQTGVYTFELEQAMREPELKGITDIGLRIIKE